MANIPPPPPTDMKNLYISSSDALRGRLIDQNLPVGWNDRPPLFLGRDSDQLLKGMIRKGVPPALRCAVWISSVIKSCHPHQSSDYAEAYRTLGKVRALDGAWDAVLKQVFPNGVDDGDVLPPTFGNTIVENYHGGPISNKGKRALLEVLCALEQFVGLDYAPLLPTLAIISLQFMSESYVFCQLREMAQNSTWYFPTSQLEHYAWCRAFADVLHRLHPHTAATMKANGSLTPDGLDPIFRHFFTPILKYEHVVRIMDIYALEGAKVIFRFGIALLCMFKMDVKDLTIKTTSGWWANLKQYTHARSFSFEVLVRKAYGYHGSRVRKRSRFPRRDILARIIRLEKERAANEIEFEAVYNPPRPLGLVEGEFPSVLAKSPVIRAHFAEWLPPSLRFTKLDMIFSTNVHGRSLERFYEHVHSSKHTFLLLQVLDTNATIGMYASQAWRISSQVYGDGDCFLFRAQPDAKCYKWKPAPVHDNEDFENLSLLEQFMVGRETFISMGGNSDGSSGLRLNEDMTKGESAPAVGFDNEPLAASGVFDVGLVEVYRLVRQMDGKSVDDPHH